MSEKPEQGLTDAAPGPIDDDLEAVEDEASPEDFDIDALVHGVRATRVRVKIQPNGHLLARLQELAEQIDAYPTDDDLPDDLADEWVETKAAFDHLDTYVIEGRTSDWQRAFQDEMKARGVNPKRKGLSEAERAVHVRRLAHAQIAMQCVEPAGVTESDIKALYEGNEPEADKLFQAVRQANTQPVKALVPDFSRTLSRLSRRG